MFVRAFGGAAAVVGIGMYLHSAFGPSYSRTVDRTPTEVRNALEDLDIRNAPGAPASDPTRSGGIAPTFQLTEQGDDMIWTIMSGDKVAVRLIAHLAAADGGEHTKVTAEVERGDAPDDYVAPAFRSTSLTRSLFGMVLDQELDAMNVTQAADSPTCQKILEDFEAGAPSFDQQRGFGGVAKTALKLNALESQLKAAGCPVNAPGSFETPKAVLTEGSDPPAMTSADGSGSGNIRPGQPMLDLSKH